MVRVLQRSEVETTPPVRFAFERWLGAVGAIVALLGVWLGAGPEDGTLTIFAWDVEASGLSDVWYQVLIVGGLGIIGVAFALAGRKLHFRDGWWSSAAVWAIVMAIVSLGAGVAFGIASLV
jgi:hypothetical protein